jgi:hypothetical protein
MTNGFEFLDYAVFVGYAILILGVGLWVSHNKQGMKKMLKINFWQANHCLGGLLNFVNSCKYFGRTNYVSR